MNESAPKSPGKGRPRSQESEDSILDATMFVLAQEGYRGLTTDKIAARASASKSTIYRRWPTKELLVLSAFDQTPLLTAINTGKLLNDILEILLQFIGFFHETPMGDVFFNLIVERLHNKELKDALAPIMERREEPIKEVLTRAIGRKELPEKTNVDTVQDAIIGMVLFRMLFRPLGLGRKELREALKPILKGFGATA